MRRATSEDSLPALVERERARVLAGLAGRRRRPRNGNAHAGGEAGDGGAPLLVRDELSALLPRPTPFSAGFMRRRWAANGSVDLACRDLGAPYEVHPRSVPCLETLFGWTYVNVQEMARRLGEGPGAAAGLRLARDAERHAAGFATDFLPRFRDEMKRRDAIVKDRLPLRAALELLADWSESHLANTCVEVERLDIAARFHLRAATAKLAEAKLDPASHLGIGHDGVTAKAMARLRGDAVEADAVARFLTVFGHRAPLDHELAMKRFGEDPALAARYVQRSREAAPREAAPPDIPPTPMLRTLVERARTFRRLREDANHHCLTELARIRRLALSIDAACGLDGRVFQLDLDEVLQLGDGDARRRLVALAEERVARASAWADLRPPDALDLGQLERMDFVTGSLPDAGHEADPGAPAVAA